MIQIHAAQEDYLREYGQYASSLSELISSVPSSYTAPSSGYRFELQRHAPGYTLRATPSLCEKSARSFFSDQTGQIHQRACPDRAGLHDALVK